MGMLLRLIPKPTPSHPIPAGGRSGGAKVLLFTGVRYERGAEAKPAATTGRRRKG